MNIISYIEKYKDKSFDEEEFNEIDNLIFSNIIYLNFTDIVLNNDSFISLYEAGSIFIGKYTYKEISKIGFAQKDGYNILKKIYNTKRYSSVLLNNYIYIGDENEQFSALTFKVNETLKYICFEGTDNLLSGWKEDFMMAYIFPVPSQKYAINYLNNVVKFYDKNIIVGGHSKGGNLALVAAMNLKIYKRHKLKLIYNNDGPGLRKKEIESKNYKRVKEKYIHIIPDYSYIGILLRDEVYKVIKSTKKNIMSHDMNNWLVDDKKLVLSELSLISKKTSLSILSWLDSHNDEERKKIIDSVFISLEDAGVYYTKDIRKLKSILSIVENLRNIDNDSKRLIKDFLEYNINFILNDKE